MLADSQKIITFTCRLRLILINHLKLSTLSKYYSGHVRPGKMVLQRLLYLSVRSYQAKNQKYRISEYFITLIEK
jgi:hypothetical protein